MDIFIAVLLNPSNSGDTNINAFMERIKDQKTKRPDALAKFKSSIRDLIPDQAESAMTLISNNNNEEQRALKFLEQFMGEFECKLKWDLRSREFQFWIDGMN